APPSPCKTFYQDLLTRATTPPPSTRAARPEVSPELDEVIARMMALRPDDRYPSAEAVMQALLPFLSPVLRDRIILSGGRSSGQALWKTAQKADESARVYRVLI